MESYVQYNTDVISIDNFTSSAESNPISQLGAFHNWVHCIQSYYKSSFVLRIVDRKKKLISPLFGLKVGIWKEENVAAKKKFLLNFKL